LFRRPVAEYTPAQKSLVSWLHYYDQYYERIAGEDGIEPWMVNYPELVDSFFTWHERKLKAERKESRHSSQPKATDHKEVYTPRHR